MPLTGFSSGAMPADCLLESGIIQIGSTILSATRGGISFDPKKVIENIQFDGKRSDVYLLDRTKSFAPMISGTIIEMGTQEAPVLEPGATSSSGGAGVTVYTPKRAGTLYVAGDYQSNVRAIWERGNNSGYWQVRFPKALVLKYSVVGKDGEEAAIAIEIAARLDMSGSNNIADAPYVEEFLASLS